jgi:hypothetical protein
MGHFKTVYLSQNATQGEAEAKERKKLKRNTQDSGNNLFTILLNFPQLLNKLCTGKQQRQKSPLFMFN